ncbi:MAG: winged helix-turn-helix domain-containing protein [Chloroflexi bacterium]|nr:winged helix-turn-helix domain-containing protein [Chloroflexota bacterium]
MIPDWSKDGGIVPSKVRIPRIRALGRERLGRHFEELWHRRLTLVVAPAGSGKSTLLAGWAEAAATTGVPTAWYRAEGTDGDPLALLGYLRAAVAEAGGADIAAAVAADPWTSVEVAARSLEAWPGGRLLLVIDDLHTLAGSAAESTLERFLDYTEPWLALAAGTRALPSFNLSRRRVAEGLLEITGDDLRFRPWEIELLFRDFYGESLRPEELARLARRTEGWAAGLQLFHLATRGKSPAERTNLLDVLGSGSRLLREYLARNVIDELPEDLRRFVVDTCVLRRLTGPLCDAFLERDGSGARLAELERRQVFTVSVDGNGTYRYHEVLRGHLEGLLVEERGEAGARLWSTRAGSLLEREGAIAEALAAYCRGESWEAAARVVGAGGPALASGSSAAATSWLDAVPAALLDQDPWLIVASARRLRADGQWRASMEAFGRAEAVFGAADAAVTCRRERLALAAFLDPMARPVDDWPGSIRAALARDPLGRRAVLAGMTASARGRPADTDRDGNPAVPEPGDRLAAGLGHLLAGRPLDAVVVFTDVARDPATDPPVAIAAGIGIGTAHALTGDPAASAELELAVASAENAGLLWLARLARAATVLANPPSDAEIGHSGWGAAGLGAGWGDTVAGLIDAWAGLDRPRPTPATLEAALAAAEAASRAARILGALTLETWARALEALAAARLGLADARDRALQAESLVRNAAVPGARVLVHEALAESSPDRAGEHLALANAARIDTGLRAPGSRHSDAGDAAPGDPTSSNAAPGVAAPRTKASEVPPVDLHLLGGFSLAVGGRTVDLSAMKPRPRALLRLLALDAGRLLHREVLAATFWPDADPQTAARNLHVALSGLRRELAASGFAGALVREGDAYRLSLPPGSRVDLIDVLEAVSAGRAARSRGRIAEAAEQFRIALGLGASELLPEDGPADWVVGRREEVRTAVADAARTLAELLLDGEPVAAAEACSSGLRVDPYNDGLWRLLATARERAGDPAAAATVRQAYGRMLARLGVAGDPEIAAAVG